MAFGNVTTLYLPTAANAGASLWGTDVRKVLAAADAASDATSKTNHSTGGAVTRTVDPYTTTTIDDVQANFGWAVAPTDMNSVAGAKRFMRAGNHVATVRMGHNGATGVTATLFVFVYRVGPAAGRTRTLLGSSSATFALPATSGEVTASVTVALGEVIFEVDETLQYSFEVSCAGIAAVGRIVTMFAGTQTVACRLDIPKLGVLADSTGSATGSGEATGATSKVLAVVGSAAGSVAVDGVGASRADTTGTATGSGTATGLVSSVAGMTGTATGSGTATGVFGAIGAMVGSADGSSTVTGLIAATGGMVGTASGSGVASAQASSVSGSVGTAWGSGTAAGLMSIVLGTVGAVTVGEGGGGGGPVTPEEITAIAAAAANAVWDELTAEARASGSYGELVVARIDANVSSRSSASDVAALQLLVDDLEGRLTSARALLLDNLDATVSSRATSASVAALGAPAQAADLTTLEALVDDLESRLTAARAALLDNLPRLDVAVSSVSGGGGGSSSAHVDIS